MIFDIFQLAVGLAMLLAGGELVVRSASAIARILGMSKLLVGLTVVAFGTSAPELAICIDAVWKGKSDIAVGNIIGSNIANVLLILGLTATIFPIVIQKRVIHREIPIMIGVSILFLVLAIDGVLHPTDGLVLLAGMAVFVVWQIRAEKKAKDAERAAGNNETESAADDPTRAGSPSIWLNIAILVAGVACLWFGAAWLVEGASKIAMGLGVSKLVIGLTVVAIGSSAPEIVTSLLAAKHGHPELAVGNVIGSNIANLLLVAGAASAFSTRITVPEEAFQFDIPIMLASSIACLPVFATSYRIDRWKGILFLLCFATFNLVLFIKPILIESFPNLQRIYLFVSIPMVVVTCIAIAQHNNRDASRKHPNDDILLKP